jgi:hypothetical protein
MRLVQDLAFFDDTPKESGKKGLKSSTQWLKHSGNSSFMPSNCLGLAVS